LNFNDFTLTLDAILLLAPQLCDVLALFMDPAKKNGGQLFAWKFLPPFFWLVCGTRWLTPSNRKDDLLLNCLFQNRVNFATLVQSPSNTPVLKTLEPRGGVLLWYSVLSFFGHTTNTRHALEQNRYNSGQH